MINNQYKIKWHKKDKKINQMKINKMMKIKIKRKINSKCKNNSSLNKKIKKNICKIKMFERKTKKHNNNYHF